MKSVDATPLLDARPREVMMSLRAAGIRAERLTEEAPVDFVISHAPPRSGS